jgi:hypothetical protein
VVDMRQNINNDHSVPSSIIISALLLPSRPLYCIFSSLFPALFIYRLPVPHPHTPPTYTNTKHSVAVLCGELLREAEFLVNQRVHPMTIMAGWRQVNATIVTVTEQCRIG